MKPQPIRDVSLQEFGELPVRATVAFAVRCARRIQARFDLPDDFPARDQAFAVLDEILDLGEAFAAAADADFEKARRLQKLAFNLGEATFALSQMVPYAASHVAMAVAEGFDLQVGKVSGSNATEVMASAFGASRVVLTGGTGSRPGAKTMDVILRAFRSDMDKLYEMDLGRYADLGQRIDASEAGPLGPLWPEGPPVWAVEM